MPATTNPLRKSKPASDQCILRARFYFTDANGRLASSPGTQVCLTAEDLWITPELSIPVDLVESVQLVARRGLPPRRFLWIRFVNPITSAREDVFLCKPDPVGIGLYRVKPLADLKRRIEEQPRRRESSLAPGGMLAGAAASKPVDRCEVCGARPAYYVSYVFLVSAVLLSYRSAARRRMHCRKHNAIHGLAYYLLTVLTGWIGIGLLSYPLVVFAAARNLAPWIGKASIVLGVLPVCVAAILVGCWFF